MGHIETRKQSAVLHIVFVNYFLVNRNTFLIHNVALFTTLIETLKDFFSLIFRSPNHICFYSIHSDKFCVSACIRKCDHAIV